MAAVHAILARSSVALLLMAAASCGSAGPGGRDAADAGGANGGMNAAISGGKGGNAQVANSLPPGETIGGSDGATVNGGSGVGPSNGGNSVGGTAFGGSNAGSTPGGGNASGASLGGSNAAGASAGSSSSTGSHTGSNSVAGAPGAGSGAAGAPAGGGSSSGSAGAGSGSISYSTDFNLTESPISEGGKWKHNGLDWTQIVTAGGYAHGTQTGSAGFNDSYAYLAGNFPPNQSASAVIHLESGLSPYQEVEILLRWTDSAHNSTGYECNLAYNGQYAEIIIWPGPFATQKSQFKWVSSGNPVSGGVHDGDVFQADVIGNVITARLNGKVIATGTDSSITSGSPGMGFYAEGAAASQKFSFSKFTATGL